MPDDRGVLSIVERDKCAAWFEEMGRGSVECPICKTSKWNIEDHLVKTHILIPGRRRVEGGPMDWFFLVCCQKCSHTMFENAVDSNIIPPKSPSNPSRNSQK